MIYRTDCGCVESEPEPAWPVTRSLRENIIEWRAWSKRWAKQSVEHTYNCEKSARHHSKLDKVGGR